MPRPTPRVKAIGGFVRAAWFFPFAAFIAAPIALYAVTARGFGLVAHEDHLAEWLTFGTYLAAAGVALVLGLRLARDDRWLEAATCGALAFGCLYVAGEEISWAQRVLDFDGPSTLVAANLQAEANTHNLLNRYALHAVYIATGLAGALAPWIVPRIAPLHRVAWIITPPRWTAPWFLTPVAFYAWFDYVNPLLVAAWGSTLDLERIDRLQELPELALACAVMFTATAALRRFAGHRIAASIAGPRQARSRALLAGSATRPGGARWAPSTGRGGAGRPRTR